MTDISATGVQVQIIASNTFPIGFNINQFADDADPLDSASIQIADKAMGLNGDLVSWATASPIPMILNLIPGSDDDRNLSMLAEMNRIGRGKTGAKDKITAIVVYPDNEIYMLTDGIMTDAQMINSSAQSGRKKTRSYVFAFENKVGA